MSSYVQYMVIDAGRNLEESMVSLNRELERMQVEGRHQVLSVDHKDGLFWVMYQKSGVDPATVEEQPDEQKTKEI